MNSNLESNIDQLAVCCGENIEYFKSSNSKSSSLPVEEFNKINATTASLKVAIKQVASFYHEYDFDDNTPFNGYRSIEIVASEAFIYCLQMAQKIQKSRRKFSFSAKTTGK